jgi:hypothetical protein
LGKEFKAIKEPMSEGYHPEVDDLSLCTEYDSAKCRSITGGCIRITVLGIFDLAYDTPDMSRFGMLHREGHLRTAKRILSYVKIFPKRRVIIDSSYPEHSVSLLRII